MARRASFGTYFLVGFVGMLIGSIVGKAVVELLKEGTTIRKIIELKSVASKINLTIWYEFPLNLVAIIGIIMAIYIYRRI